MGVFWRYYKKLKKSTKPYTRMGSDVGLVVQDIRKSARTGRLHKIDRAMSSVGGTPKKKKKKRR